MVKILSPERLLKRMTGQKPSKTDRDREWSHAWSFITIEGFCFIDIDYNRTKSKHMWEFIPTADCEFTTPDDATRDFMKAFRKVPNPDYDPDVKRNPIPKFCKKHVCIACLENKCEHLSFSEAEDAILKGVEEIHDKLVEEEDKQWEREEAARNKKAPCDCKEPCKECTCDESSGGTSRGGVVRKPRSTRSTKVRKGRHDMVPDARDEVPDGSVDNQR